MSLSDEIRKLIPKQKTSDIGTVIGHTETGRAIVQTLSGKILYAARSSAEMPIRTPAVISGAGDSAAGAAEKVARPPLVQIAEVNV